MFLINGDHDTKAKSYTGTTAIGYNCMVGRLDTGISVLDRKLDGGLPPGCLVAFAAEPASQSELLLYELTAARGTLYLSTERTDDAVRHAIETSPSSVGSPTVRHVASDTPLEEATQLIGALPDGANLIIDTLDVLERTDTDDYVDFLNELKSTMLETGSIAMLHCLKGHNEPANRMRTYHAVDAVFDLRTEIAGTELENHLTIPKFRGGRQPTEAIKLELTEEVAIDTSRDIA
ncbi:RecA-superfamily ATPase, KaiC/GvpD/RAD55 family [Natrinema hispanicum]|uniref:RecA-superfamily ATPase, KaiC/GvpD/RAD55 family n=2 Tax=Natrinema hispanicum TaxID=392421 RepID=A0A1I0GAU7_9EURY|nr:RecA-superfamily ATPase, KaiC/GvpD/RAD55 family [Natrinema hispanicum]